MANQVTYHLPDGRKPWVLTVLKKNADGTLELAGEDGQLKVGKCPVSDEPREGHCTLGVVVEVAAESPAPTAPAEAAPAESPEEETAESLLKPKSKKK
jgi:hypothetical protein